MTANTLRPVTGRHISRARRKSLVVWLQLFLLALMAASVVMGYALFLALQPPVYESHAIGSGLRDIPAECFETDLYDCLTYR